MKKDGLEFMIIENVEKLKILDYKNIEVVNNSYTDTFIKFILKEAITFFSSDIHIEPSKIFFRIRIRKIGELEEIGKYNYEKYNSLITRIKIICGLDIAEKRVPQEGRFNGVFKESEFDFRVSIIPVYFGEKISIRILKRKKVIKTLEELGLNKEIYTNILKCLKKKFGLILISGPMGSGKTTSLYSILNEVNKKNKNLTTIEDPIEYVIEGANQIQCNEELGLNFSKMLKIVLRQDSDIIAIGEIRDKETASVALSASLTGHLILSTIHSKNSKSTLKRLEDLDINMNLITEGITAILSQKLIRVLCPDCKRVDNDYKKKISELRLTEQDLKRKKIYKSKGCKKCSYTGYIERAPIVELLVKKDNRILEKKDNEGLWENFEKISGSIFKDGLRIVLEGRTSLDELIKVM